MRGSGAGKQHERITQRKNVSSDAIASIGDGRGWSDERHPAGTSHWRVPDSMQSALSGALHSHADQNSSHFFSLFFFLQSFLTNTIVITIRLDVANSVCGCTG